jgi:hypothetical protein
MEGFPTFKTIGWEEGAESPRLSKDTLTMHDAQ